MAEQLLRVALEAGRAGTAVHRAMLGRIEVGDWSTKGTADYVTAVDREAEACIIERIRASFPDHEILAEEAATSGDGTTARIALAEWLWVIDPIDGTTNFLHEYPMYAASVAVLHRGELVAGAVVNGATAEEWTAVRGGGAFKDGKRIHVSAISELSLALIGTGFPFKALDQLPEYLAQLGTVLRSTSGIRRAGSAALDLCHLATGYFDGFWELVLAPWDIAAGALIVREAGGLVTTLDGRADVLAGGAVLAGNPVIHGALGELVRATSLPADRGAPGSGHA
jgi:myo-inositol-1(or 4)-monophosphatase